MARRENVLDSVDLRIASNPMIKGHLEALVRTGTYGKNATEAAERIISEEIRRLLNTGVLRPLTKSD